jgi:hypothetical protein
VKRQPILLASMTIAVLSVPLAGAQADDGGASPTAAPAPKAGAAMIKTTAKHFNVVKGSTASLRGRLADGASGRVVSLQLRLRGRWVNRDTTRTDGAGRYRLAYRPAGTGAFTTRVAMGSTAAGAGRLDVFRRARATWYGPGLYGNHLACGGRLTTSTIGVAHKTLPCGTKITLRYKGRELRVKVIDRGPFSRSLDYDLTSATKRKLGYPDVGTVLATR